jgi:hypothetical protein
VNKMVRSASPFYLLNWKTQIATSNWVIVSIRI